VADDSREELDAPHALIATAAGTTAPMRRGATTSKSGAADKRHVHDITGPAAGGGRSALDFNERRRERDTTAQAGMKRMAAPRRSPNGCPPDVVVMTFVYPNVGDPRTTK
jgi:hypothetical protein